MERARRPLRPRRPPVAAAPAGSAPSRTLSPSGRGRLALQRERGEGKPLGQPPPLEVKASAVSLGNKGRDDLALGQRVFHGKFGYGTIAAIEGNKLEIDFEHAGRKKVLDSFVSVAGAD